MEIIEEHLPENNKDNFLFDNKNIGDIESLIKIKTIKIIYPPKLKKWDNIRVIAPARTMSLLSEDTIKQAVNRLEEFWFTISFWKNVNEVDEFLTSSVESRIEDLHDAFSDKTVNWILSVVWWYSSNQLLDYIDYELIKNNPKILCWFSDITALSNAILAKTWIVWYSWPHFSSWGIKHWFDFSIDFFDKCCVKNDSYELKPSKKWSDDEWYLDQEKRNFIDNEWYWVLNEWSAKWRLIGGHLPCINSLQWSKYWVNYEEKSVLFIEIDEEFGPVIFDRGLQSLIQQKDFNNIKWIVIWRFQKKNNMSRELLEKIIKSKKELDNLPIIANVDFWHTMPFITFPIGWEVEINTDNISITILNH